MNYKSGDLVKITGNCNGHRFKIGGTVRLQYKCRNNGWRAKSLSGISSWYVMESDMTPTKPATMPQKIVITTDGKTTLARLFDGKTMVKRAEAKCAPSDTFNFGVGAELAVKRLMGGKPVAGNPVTEPAEDSDPVKLYCVKSFLDALSAGKIYEPDESGYITYDDGCKSNYSVSDWKFNFIRTGNLVPLVRRPAKVGEWVYVTHTDYKDDLEPGDIAQVIGAGSGGSICIAKDRTAYLGGLCYHQDEYLVLDGYTGEPA